MRNQNSKKKSKFKMMFKIYKMIKNRMKIRISIVNYMKRKKNKIRKLRIN